MEQLNRIELRGIVGSVRESKVGDRILVQLTVATNFMYKNKDGLPVIETTWHQVEKFFDRSPEIKKGGKVYVLGRLKAQRYTREDGVEMTSHYVHAMVLGKIYNDEHLTFEV